MAFFNQPRYNFALALITSTAKPDFHLLEELILAARDNILRGRQLRERHRLPGQYFNLA